MQSLAQIMGLGNSKTMSKGKKAESSEEQVKETVEQKQSRQAQRKLDRIEKKIKAIRDKADIEIKSVRMSKDEIENLVEKIIVPSFSEEFNPEGLKKKHIETRLKRALKAQGYS